MDSKEFQKYLPYNDNIHYEWFLVQYDQDTRKLTRKVCRSNELIWNEELLNIESNDGGHKKEHVLIRDLGKLHIGYILYKAKTQEECIEHHTFLQLLCMQLLHSPHEISDVMEHLHFNRSYWLLVMYSRSPMRAEQVVYAVFHKNDVILKMDNHLHALMAFVQEDQSTYKGMVVKIANDLNDIMFIMDHVVRTELFRMFQDAVFADPATKNQEFHQRLAVLHQRMQWESNILLKGLKAVEKNKTRLQYRLMYLQNAYQRNRH